MRFHRRSALSHPLALQAIYHAKLTWTWEAKKQNRRAADAFMATNCRLIHATNSETVLREVLDFQKTVEDLWCSPAPFPPHRLPHSGLRIPRTPPPPPQWPTYS